MNMDLLKKIFIFSFALIALFTSQSLFAQQTVIKGKVRDSVSAISYANIELKNIADTSDRQQTWTDSLGYFQFEAQPHNKYRIRVSHLDYREFISDEVQVNADNKTEIIDILLQRAGKELEEVTVSSKKKMYETNDGKLIFNVQNSASTSGLTALELLKRLQGVTVGQNDEVLFRGASGVNVMISGKMTYLSGTQLANYLKGLSAEDINKVELITAPTSEFDAAGNAGIINIIPKKNTKKGYALDVRVSGTKGKYWMTNENISASIRTKNLGLYGSYDFNTPHSFYQNKSGNEIQKDGETLQLNRDAGRAYKVKYHTWRAGAEWQFLPRHNVGIHYHGYLDDFKSFNNSDIGMFDRSQHRHLQVLSNNEIIEPYHYDALSFNYRYDIDSSGKKITADANYIYYRNYSNNLMRSKNFDGNNNFIYENQLRASQPGFVKIKSANVDAHLPFKTLLLKAGLKYAEVNNDNQYRFDSLKGETFVEIASMSNHFKYEEKIAAAYLSASKEMNKTIVEAGLRAENTDARGYTMNGDFFNTWKYAQLFPSLLGEQVINDDSKLDFSFSRRINRPNYTFLNPVRWYTDPYFYWLGNPRLVPELAWVYSLNYQFKKKYILTASYNQSNNYISRTLSMDDAGAVRALNSNFENRKRFDLTLSTPVSITRFWDAQLLSGLNFTSYPISMLSGEKLLRQWATSFSLQQDFSLPKGYKITLSAIRISSELSGIYKTKPNGYVDAGIRKSFLDNRLEAKFSVNDIFNTNRIHAISQSDIINYYYNEKPYSRIFGLSFTYRLGGELFKASNKKPEEQERL